MSELLEKRREAWDLMFNDPNLSLNSLRHRAVEGTVCQNGLRSVCWKVFLGYLPTLELSTWPAIYLEERQRYSDLKRQHIEEPAEMMSQREEEDLSDNNPLALSETNPWQQYFADSEIRKVIRQDVERTFPDVDFFRSDKVQQHLTDILFIYCKLNRDTSYRQGMHELLAPFYWVISSESVNMTDTSDPIEKLMIESLDSAYIEHDAYILFDKLMRYGKSWYEFNEEPQTNNKSKKDILSENIPKPSDSARLNPVVMICQRIHHNHLRTADPVLYRHLQDFGIEPQLYGLRWIRLLFGREFDVHELLKLWDAIFAQDPTFEIVEYVCLVMLLHMRDQLLERDYAECLSMLMRPPQIAKPTALVKQAKYVQDHLSQDTALQILQQNDVRLGKEPRSSLYDGVKLPETRRTLHHRPSQGSNMDNSFSRITNNMMKNPQFRDFNKAIAGVMESIQNNVNFGETTGRRSTVSEFPSSIDRVFPKSRNEKVQTGAREPKDTDAKLVAMNKQMGELVSNCISLLEKEIFPPLEESVKQTSQEGDESDQRVVSEKDQESERTYGVKNEASVVMALAGLKHVRDVLVGKQPQFDASLMKITTAEEGGDLDWHLVEPKDVVETPVEQPKRDESPELKRHSSSLTESKLRHVAYVPENPTVPKPAVKYSIEDLLSDPGLRSSSSKTLASAKLKSMLIEQEAQQQSTPHELYKSSPRKRSSFYKTIPVLEGENTVDPLDAKNVDNRKAYEYDLI